MQLRERLAAIPAARGDGRGFDPLARLHRPHAAFVTSEEHLAIDDLGLAIIGRHAPDAMLRIHTATSASS